MRAALAGIVAAIVGAAAIVLTLAAPAARADLSSAFNPFAAYQNNIARVAGENDAPRCVRCCRAATAPMTSTMAGTPASTLPRPTATSRSSRS